jgi:nucleotide-binding universal stress UspA family protein
VHVDLGRAAAQRAELASKLADRFEARLVGVAAEEPLLQYYEDGLVAMGDQITLDRKRRSTEEYRRVANNLAQTEALFQTIASKGPVGRNVIDWRSEPRSCRELILELALPSDLVVAGRSLRDDWALQPVGVSPGELVLGLGCPLLLVPPAIDGLSAMRVVIAWSGTREATRAVHGSVPFLQRAREVIIVSVGAVSGSRFDDDIPAYLRRCGVASVRLIHLAGRASVASQIFEVVDGEGADLMIAGAYGHSRLREWIFGGVTRELIETCPVCCLMAH